MVDCLRDYRRLRERSVSKESPIISTLIFTSANMKNKELKRSLDHSDQEVFDILSELEEKYQVYIELSQINIEDSDKKDGQVREFFHRDLNHPLTLSIK